MSLRNEIARAIRGARWADLPVDEEAAADAVLALLREGPWFDGAVERADAHGQQTLFARGIKRSVRLAHVAEMLREAFGGER